MGEPESLRVLLLGKQGCGKSSLANLLLGESVFSVSHSSNKEIRRSQSHTRTQTRPQTGTRTLTVVDSPGLVGTSLQGASGRAQRCEWLSALLQCAPGPHAVLLVMSVQRYTCQEEAVVRRVRTLCGDQVFGFLTVVFTHGDQLPEDMHMVQFVEQSAGLTELVQACGGRCHVVDNKYWNREPPEDSYRSNAFQVQEILATVEKTARQNQTFFSNDTLMQVEREIQAETMRIQSSTGPSPGPGLGPGPGLEESREQAKTLLLDKYMKEATARPPYLKYTVMAAAGVLGVAVICYTLPKVIRWLREVPLVPEMVPEVPLVPEMVPEVPLVPEIVPEVPLVPEMVPEVPLVPEIVPEIVLVPEMLPDLPLVPNVPVIPACDIYPDLPMVPEMVPEVPLVPEIVPEVPLVPEIVPEVPLVPIDPSPSPLREVLEFILTKPEELFDKFDPYDLFLW